MLFPKDIDITELAYHKNDKLDINADINNLSTYQHKFLFTKDKKKLITLKNVKMNRVLFI